MEMLIVVIIIGVLAAIALPRYRKTIEKGFGDKAITNLKVIFSVQKMYRSDYNTYCGLNFRCNGSSFN